jgi:hypothetical protein
VAVVLNTPISLILGMTAAVPYREMMGRVVDPAVVSTPAE